MVKSGEAAEAVAQLGAYRLTVHLGRGGMADVYLGTRAGVSGFERNVVVKRILPQYQEEPELARLFVNEAKLAARLTHPNVVQIYELGEADGALFIAMEFVHGRDLTSVLRARAELTGGNAALPPAVAAFIAREVCRGLGHAHGHRLPDGSAAPIVHRDVSPQNIMIGYDGQVKLVDFGIAKALEAQPNVTGSTKLRGKVSYMAPEQLEGGPYGATVDLFAAGVVLYEMLTGQRLFKGRSEVDTLLRIMRMPIVPPSAIAGDVPAELDAVVLRALERDPQARWPQATAMARALDDYLHGVRFSTEELLEFMGVLFPPARRVLPTSARGGFTRHEKSTRRRMWLVRHLQPRWIAGAALVLGGIAVGAMAAHLHRPAPAHAPARALPAAATANGAAATANGAAATANGAASPPLAPAATAKVAAPTPASPAAATPAPHPRAHRGPRKSERVHRDDDLPDFDDPALRRR